MIAEPPPMVPSVEFRAKSLLEAIQKYPEYAQYTTELIIAQAYRDGFAATTTTTD